MASEKFNCMNKAAVESAGPPHSGSSHASFGRKLGEKSRSHNPMMRRLMVVAGGKPGGAAAGVGPQIQHWHMMIQSPHEIRGRKGRGRRIRRDLMIETHLLIFL